MYLRRTVIATLLLLGSALSQGKTPSSPVSDTELPVSTRVLHVERGSVIAQPRALHAPDPIYPRAALKTHSQGITTLSLVVGEDGKPHDIKVVQSLTPDLDQAAVDALKRWKFAPAKKDGKRVPAPLQVQFEFRLH